jgi:putative solute:sodium symporter small subunit
VSLTQEEAAAGNASPVTREVRELQEQTGLGDIYLSALIRRQLHLSLATVAIFFTALGAQPLITWFWPAFADLKVFDIPLTWLLLGTGSYPLMVLLGLNYARRAESIDDEFTDLLK